MRLCVPLACWLLSACCQTSGLLRHVPAFSLLLAVVQRAAGACVRCAEQDVAVTTLAGGLHLLRNVAVGGPPRDDELFGAPFLDQLCPARTPARTERRAANAVLKCTRLLVELLACLAAPEGPRPRTRTTAAEPGTATVDAASPEARTCSVVAVRSADSYCRLATRTARPTWAIAVTWSPRWPA